jgi:hypothetical protein
MKKQIIAAAVAASVSAIALADVSITGSAKYEYLYTDTSAGDTKNESNTEMKLAIAGKNGDTGVFIGVELDASDASDNATGNTTDIEDMYLTTKVGDINVKAGNWASSTTALLGEIDEGGRTHGKIDLSTTVSGVKVYAGNGGSQATGYGRLNENMYAGVEFTVAGNKIQAKHLNETETGYGIQGSSNGVNYRVEHKNADGANKGVTFAEVGTKIGGMGVSYAMIDAESGNLVAESDSSIFAVEMGSTSVSGTADDAQQQVTLTTDVDGNNLKFIMGQIDNGLGSGIDLDYSQIVASRKLASGATATVTYTDKDTGASSSTDTFEIDLSVSF